MSDMELFGMKIKVDPTCPPDVFALETPQETIAMHVPTKRIFRAKPDEYGEVTVEEITNDEYR